MVLQLLSIQLLVQFDFYLHFAIYIRVTGQGSFSIVIRVSASVKMSEFQTVKATL